MAEFMEMSAIISTGIALRATARALDAPLMRDIEGVSTLRYSQMIINVGKKVLAHALEWRSCNSVDLLSSAQ